jgi:hypothetical protein
VICDDGWTTARELRFPLIKYAKLGDQASDATVDSFGRIALHEMLPIVPPIPTSRLNGVLLTKSFRHLKAIGDDA